MITLLMWLTAFAGVYSSEDFKPLDPDDKNPILTPNFTSK